MTAAAQARDAVAPGQSQNPMEATQMLPAMSQLREQVAAAAEGAADAEPTLESAPVVEPIGSPEPVVEAAPEPAPAPEPVVEAAPEPAPELVVESAPLCQPVWFSPPMRPVRPSDPR